jgi:hypothetical protein
MMEQLRRQAEQIEMRRKRRQVGRFDRIDQIFSAIIAPFTLGQPITIDPGALPPTPASPLATAIASGGQVTWSGTGLAYTVAAGTGFINGVPVSWLEQTVTLDAADPDDPRIDVIYVDTFGVADSITGVPSADPSEPVTDPATQLRLALVTVAAGATAPAVTSELVYAENAGGPIEWDWTTSGTGWNLASTGSPGAPRSGVVVIEGTDVDENAYIQGQTGSPLDPAAYNQLVLYPGYKVASDPSRYLQISLRNNGVLVGNALRIGHGFFGVDEANNLNYQAVIIPMLQFAAPPATQFNQIRLEAIGNVGAAINVFIDDIILTNGGITVVGGGGLSQDEADARYAQRANNLSDLGDVPTARTNLGLRPLIVREIDGSPAETEPVALEFPNGTLANPSSGILRYTPSVSTDEKAKVSANDTTPGYFNGKLIAGPGVTLTENNDGGNETLTIAATASGGRYRAWAYTAFAAGEFTYVVDGSGAPVYALVDLE